MKHPEEIAIASDHAGVDLKKIISGFIKRLDLGICDFGTHNQDSVDYPDYGILVAQAVSEGKNSRGILICGSGIGMSILANKFSGVRAALCFDLYSAEVSRRHTDANILVLGGRVLDDKTAIKIVQLWLNTKFEGGRHLRRIRKISEVERPKDKK